MGTLTLLGGPGMVVPAYLGRRGAASSTGSALMLVHVSSAAPAVWCSSLRTCRNCKQQFEPAQNHPRACRFHTAHYGGETRRKFESVYEGGTMSTPNSGRISQYWHCCGSADPFDAGCELSPHVSYDE